MPLMHDLFELQNRLREHAVWRHPEDQKWDGVHATYPRFLAAIADLETFQDFQQQAAALERKLKRKGLTTRWVPSFFDEEWASCTVQQNHALKTQLFMGGPHVLPLPAGVEVESLKGEIDAIHLQHPFFLGEVVAEQDGQPFAAALQFTTQIPLTLRLSEGRRFRLYVRTVNQELRKDIKFGAVVTRKLHGEVWVARPRKVRSDAKRLAFSLAGLDFFQRIEGKAP